MAGLAPSSEDLLIQRETVSAAMGALSERERGVVTMRDVHGFFWREIGDELGVSRERGRQIYVKALSKMRGRLRIVARPKDGPRHSIRVPLPKIRLPKGKAPPRVTADAMLDRSASNLIQSESSILWGVGRELRRVVKSAILKRQMALYRSRPCPGYHTFLFGAKIGNVVISPGAITRYTGWT